MTVKKETKKEERSVKDVFRRISKKDFSGNTGLALKNSIYQFFTVITSKLLGSIILIAIIARYLKPELFGLYSLALSVILIFGTLAGFGVGDALTRFMSKSIGNNKLNKAIAYKSYLSRILLISTSVAIILLITLSKFIAYGYYQKPIFFSLLAGALYIALFQFDRFTQGVLMASSYFKGIFHKELIFQFVRMFLVLSIIFLLPDLGGSVELKLLLVFLAISIPYLFSSLFGNSIFLLSKDPKNKDDLFLTKKEKEITNKFLSAMFLVLISGVLISYTDIIILGRFVSSEFIGYYSAASALLGGVIPLLSIGPTVLFPIFSRLKGKQLKRGLNKSVRFVFFTSLLISILIFSFARPIINLVYGQDFVLSVNILRLFSVVLVLFSVSNLFQTYLVSQGKAGNVAKILGISTILNIILTILFVALLLPRGYMFSLYGAIFASMISKSIYLFLLFRDIRSKKSL